MMIERLKRILDKREVSGYVIKEVSTCSSEMFSVSDRVDMNRAKTVRKAILTIYADFEDKEERYRGSSVVSISPSMSDEEIEDIIGSAFYAAGFVKNKWYPLTSPSKDAVKKFKSAFDCENLTIPVLKIRNIIYEDYGYDSRVNSSEVFVEKMHTRIVNSQGVDVSFDHYAGTMEVIADSDAGEEPVEIYSLSSFADVNEESLRTLMSSQMSEAYDRAMAMPTEHLKNIDVILTDDEVKRWFFFYCDYASAARKYAKTTDAAIGESVYKNPTGDKVSLKLVSLLENSTHSAPYDETGFPLKDTVLYDDGVVKNFIGSVRFASYIGVKPTGMINNIEVEKGSLSIESMKDKPYFEILQFSDFIVDELTGDFGGEIRLAKYFDGERVISVTGGSISGNVFKVHDNVMFSEEVINLNNYKGPRAILIRDMEIFGEKRM